MANSNWAWDDALRGVIPPTISPLTTSRQVDAEAVDRVVDYVLAGGCSGLFVLGGVGEGAWLSTAQRAAIVEATVRATAGRAPVLVGLMLPGTAPAREAALQAVDAGADALVVGSPYYFGVDAASQQRHVEAILSATTLPVLLYNIPQCTHAPLAREAVEVLSTEPRILGVKDSWGDLPYFQALLTLRLKRPNFRVLQRSRPGSARRRCRSALDRLSRSKSSISSSRASGSWCWLAMAITGATARSRRIGFWAMAYRSTWCWRRGTP